MINPKKSDKANLENKKSIFFLVGLVLALVTVLMAFEWKTNETVVVNIPIRGDYVQEDHIFIPTTPYKDKEIPKPVLSVPYIEIVDNNTEVDMIIDLFSSEPTDELLFNIDELVYHSDNNKYDKEEEILLIAEEMPMFPGGNRALLSYLSGNVKYPLIAQENGIQGKVFIQFVVDEQGSISEVQVLRGVDVALDNEALRVVRQMPKWKPGRQGGKAVKVRYTVPISFKLK
jgi:protein TonB